LLAFEKAYAFLKREFCIIFSWYAFLHKNIGQQQKPVDESLVSCFFFCWEARVGKILSNW